MKNTGLDFEALIEQTNRTYAEKGWGLIQKIPTPVKVFRLSRGRIRDGVFDRKSTVDFTGIVHGRSVAFDAKDTNERTSYPIRDHIHAHQIEYLKRFKDQGGISFILLRWVKHDETYLIPIEHLVIYWDSFIGDGRKSIPYTDMVHYYKVQSKPGMIVHYLEGLEL